MKEQYPFIVVPKDKDNEILAREKGMSNTFCASQRIAVEVRDRQNLHSGVEWKIKETENEQLNW